MREDWQIAIGWVNVHAVRMDLKVIQAMLGHASIVLTADTYTSVLPDVARTTAIAAQIMKAARTPPGLTTAPPWPHAPAA